ncbi:MAG: AMP-binding protein, partial [Mycobacterium sp.]
NEGGARDIGRFASRFDCVVTDGYGSTEGGVSIGRTPDTPDGALGPLPAGVDIIDVETGQSCPPRHTGELVNVGGSGAFEGYYNNPDAEAERLVDGVYRTGDLAYRDENGYVYFVGRLGDWLRVDGENLGTAPIEQVLQRHPVIAEVAVYGIPDPSVGDQVMAALVLTPDADFDHEDFRAFLSEQVDLGPKQWPSYVRVATTLPRTATFKVLKRELAAEGVECADPVWQIHRRAELRKG